MYIAESNVFYCILCLCIVTVVLLLYLAIWAISLNTLLLVQISVWNFACFLVDIWLSFSENIIKFWRGHAWKFWKICWIDTEWPKSYCIRDFP